LERGDSPRTIGLRIERTSAELRRVERLLTGHDMRRKFADNEAIMRRVGHTLPDLSDAARARYEAERDRLAEAIDLDRAALAHLEATGQAITYGRHNVRQGDFVRSSHGWHKVVRVNAKTVTIPSLVGGSWTDTLSWPKVIGHRAETEE
jgi:hypothetical protein